MVHRVKKFFGIGCLLVVYIKVVDFGIFTVLVYSPKKIIKHKYL